MSISILLATFSNDNASQRYLDLCLRSLAAQTEINFEICLVSSGKYKPSTGDNPLILSRLKHKHFYEQTHFPMAVAKAYEMTDKKTEFIMFLNDDTVLNMDCIRHMKEVCSLWPMLVNPKSNCDDNGRFYISDTPFNKLQYRIDELEEIANRVMYAIPPQPKLVVFQDRIHLYCSMMKRELYDKVGGIDTNYLTGFDDSDLSYRARKAGIVPSVAMHAYCLHASGVTADKYLTNEQRQFNEKYFKKKFGV